APGLKCLVTSRVAMGLPQEFEFRLDPMGIGPGQAEDPAAIPESMALFIDAAVHADPGFRLTPQNRPAVQAICELLEGIPFAIVLAAGWVAHLDAGELLGQLRDNRLALLASRDRVQSRRREGGLARVIEETITLLPPA